MENNNFSKMAAFIATLRKEKGLTQKELADHLGVTDKAVSKWERGFNCPDIALLTDLSGILGVTTNELLNGERAASPAPEVDAVVESTLRYAGSSTEDIRSRGKRWKAIAIAALVLLVCVLIYMGSQWIIETGTDWVLLPASLINIVLLVALAGAFVIGKNKIATLILCGLLVYFTTSFFSGLNQNSLNQIINTAELGSRTPFIPHYAVIIVLLTLSLAVMVITFLIQNKSVSTDLIVLLTGLGFTTLIISPLTVSAIMDYVDLNGLGVDPHYPILLLPTVAMTVISLAMLGKRQLQQSAAKKGSNQN